MRRPTSLIENALSGETPNHAREAQAGSQESIRSGFVTTTIGARRHNTTPANDMDDHPKSFLVNVSGVFHMVLC